MKMNKPLSIILLFVGLIISLTALGFAYFLIGPGGEVIGGTVKYWHECTVTVDEELIGTDVSIESANCANTGKKCGYVFGILDWIPFGNAEGQVQLWDNSGVISTESYKTGTTSGKDIVTIRGCTSDSSVTVKLYDESGNLVDTY